MSYADLVVKGNAVFTSLESGPKSAAVIVTGDRIDCVADLGEEAQFIGPDTKVVDAGDNLVCPGLNDAHTHLLLAGVQDDPDCTLNLEGVFEQEQCLSMIADFAEAHPDNAWILCSSFDYDKWVGESKPCKELLDEIVPDRPVFIDSWDMHVAWVNSLAIKEVGFTPETHIDGGVIYHNEDGSLTGILAEPPVVDTVKALGLMSMDMESVMKKVQAKALSLGLTGASIVFPYGGVDEAMVMGILRKLELEGELKMRITTFLELRHSHENCKRFQAELASTRLRFVGMKNLVDGVCEAHTAYLTEPYADEPETCGEPALSYDELLSLLLEADADRYPVRLHTIGNGAVKMALDAFEEVRKRNGNELLHNALEHIETCRPEDIPRFADLGVVASMQPMHAVISVGYEQYTGEKWMPYMWPIRSLLDAGAVVAFGSDNPVWKLDPREELYAAVTRKRPWDHEPEEGFIPEQAITLAESIRAYSYGSAYVASVENEVGTLEAGKLADMIIFDRNLFAVPAEEIPESHVETTIIGGEIVYQA